jgi:hypothetical protein
LANAKEIPMARKWTIGFACVALLAATGCADMTDKQRSTAIGAGAGALGGAAIGSLSGDAGKGAAIGAGAGASPPPPPRAVSPACSSILVTETAAFTE